MRSAIQRSKMAIEDARKTRSVDYRWTRKSPYKAYEITAVRPNTSQDVPLLFGRRIFDVM